MAPIMAALCISIPWWINIPCASSSIKLGGSSGTVKVNSFPSCQTLAKWPAGGEFVAVSAGLRVSFKMRVLDRHNCWWARLIWSVISLIGRKPCDHVAGPLHPNCYRILMDIVHNVYQPLRAVELVFQAYHVILRMSQLFGSCWNTMSTIPGVLSF